MLLQMLSQPQLNIKLLKCMNILQTSCICKINIQMREFPPVISRTNKKILTYKNIKETLIKSAIILLSRNNHSVYVFM
jgi:hypothetical protein